MSKRENLEPKAEGRRAKGEGVRRARRFDNQKRGNVKMAKYILEASDSIGVSDAAKLQVIEYINAQSNIPPDAKASITEYIQDFWDDASQMIFDKLPPEISEYKD
jgi:hypothetical protein